MEIFFYSEEIDFPNINESLIKDWILKVINHYKYSIGTISIVFCSDDYILDINRKFLAHDYLTDIITFNYSTSNKISGDLFISIDTVKSNSIKFKAPFNIELNRVIIHGILHLIGFNDKTQSEKLDMRNNEDFCLSLIPSLSD